MNGMIWIGVALAGGCGAAARFTLDFYITQRTGGGWPWGTWTVNVTGSLLIGILIGAATVIDIPAEWIIILGGGFIGAYTTFSTWMYETIRLIDDRAWRAAGANIVAGIFTGPLTAGLGMVAGACAL